jgi:hypothetical protein
MLHSVSRLLVQQGLDSREATDEKGPREAKVGVELLTLEQSRWEPNCNYADSGVHGHKAPRQYGVLDNIYAPCTSHYSQEKTPQALPIPTNHDEHF